MAEARERPRKRVEQAAHRDDVEAVGYGPGDPVKVPERYADYPVHREKSGEQGKWNDDLARPEASAVYIVDERYLYATDRAGRVTHAEGWLGWLPSERNDDRRDRDAQLEAGEPDRREYDDGGHIFGTALNGPGEAINLTAQSRAQNQPQTGKENWRRMEESWEAMRASGIQVHAEIDVVYPDGSSRRPEARKVVSRSEGERSPRRIFKDTKPRPSRER